MPDPFIILGCWVLVSFLGPDVFARVLTLDFIGFYPVLGDVFLVAPAYGAALRFTQLLHIG